MTAITTIIPTSTVLLIMITVIIPVMTHGSYDCLCLSTEWGSVSQGLDREYAGLGFWVLRIFGSQHEGILNFRISARLWGYKRVMLNLWTPHV